MTETQPCGCVPPAGGHRLDEGDFVRLEVSDYPDGRRTSIWEGFLHRGDNSHQGQSLFLGGFAVTVYDGSLRRAVNKVLAHEKPLAPKMAEPTEFGSLVEAATRSNRRRRRFVKLVGHRWMDEWGYNHDWKGLVDPVEVEVEHPVRHFYKSSG